MSHLPQNAHIADKLRQVDMAARQLILRDCTVLRITVEGRNPVIEIQAPPAWLQLRSVVHKRLGHGGQREEHRVAIYNHCQVTWRVSA